LPAFLLLQDPAKIYEAVGGLTDSTIGNPVFGIVYNAFMARYQSAAGAMWLMAIPLICSMLCGTACITANSRCVRAHREREPPAESGRGVSACLKLQPAK
jgi:hypothetical protein